MATGNVNGPQHGNDQSTQDQETPAERRMANWTIVVGIFTALLFATSAFSDYVIWRELHGSERTQGFNEEQERAFLSLGTVIQINGKEPKTEKPAAAFIAQWTNVGATRTKWASGWASVQYFSDAVPYNFDTTKPNIALDGSVRTVVGPNQALQTAPIGITADNTVSAGSGKGVLLAWGAVDYADLYDPQTVRHGRFCEKLIPAGEAIDPATKLITVIYKPVPYKNDCNTTE